MTNKEIVERMERLEEDNARLREDLTALRASLAGEVRTRRLVVEEEDGFERIVAAGGAFFGAVTVRARPVDGATARVALIGSDEYLAPVAKVYVSAGTGTDPFGVLEASAAMCGEESRCQLRLDAPEGGPGVIADSAGPTQLAERVDQLERDNAQLRRVLFAVGCLLDSPAVAVEPQEVPA